MTWWWDWGLYSHSYFKVCLLVVIGRSQGRGGPLSSLLYQHLNLNASSYCASSECPLCQWLHLLYQHLNFIFATFLYLLCQHLNSNNAFSSGRQHFKDTINNLNLDFRFISKRHVVQAWECATVWYFMITGDLSNSKFWWNSFAF